MKATIAKRLAILAGLVLIVAACSGCVYNPITIERAHITLQIDRSSNDVVYAEPGTVQ